jgi:energy-coupling factor transporter ATP-binding protein EcfA2
MSDLGTVTLTLKNCNNIDNGSILIKKNVLNIKYGINGIGKSSIAKAILCFSEDQNNDSDSLKQLKPFKYIGQAGNDPEISGMDEINNVKIFNEDYVNEFVFLPNELLKGSFDIFIRNDAYEKGLKEINELVAIIGKTFDENEEIDNLIADLNELSSSFGKTTKSGIHASSIFSKAFKNGNKVTNIPKGLENYKDYIRHDENYKWIKWQLDGQPYLNITENCPYCVSNIEEKKETIEHITEVYDSKSVQNLNTIINIFHKLDKYFSKETRLKIDEFIKNTEGFDDEQVAYLREIKDQIDRLNEKFIKTKKIGFISLKDVDKVIEELKSRKIDLKLYNHLKSEDTQTTVAIVNGSIDTTLEKVGVLQGEINKQKDLIERLIKEHKTEINSFLKNAGYGYNVDLIDDSEGNYKLKLLHNDVKDEMTDVKEHLSFGERNAFSLVLFMYDVLKHSPDLVILDDPISSFDKNKKYAIVDILFSKEKSLKGKTVLLLTHDFEPIIDMIHHHRNRFEIPTASFLENNHGVLVEKEIQRADVQTFIEINESNIKNLPDQIINKLVYLRRLYEIKNAKGNGYQLISNLMHKREKPEFKDESSIRDMTPNEIDSGNSEIQELIDDFDYSKVLDIINDDKEMKRIYSETKNSYEKLHIYRIIFDNKDKTDSSVIKKFIDEAFHIENDYIYQLNPCKYQMVPQFVIDECDKAISGI